ncbi:N-acetyl-1-D-myo-inositol-2-amino-2-deoxy-alpha-D-glucopyranoside deacetylase [uncultured Corynebacterium sp.]|uniref:N-acetyl-1-D-myo-inositol-2-amino-2-deoxy-alpha- D-glucopyranoside deacetylase n=1 Tax=uncultured Corynebacterium sp. TaxID=159447 RepID=UPI0025FF7C1A|nr:N-acetyl-1-D-myo-inositol-2-amino-2-deoxy-alpha-D-glucopyranoside deacetylase [uncultured Corynebacterium sp.]
MTDRNLRGIRVLAVHAHPDDESLWTGLALAQWARRGAEVTVVTCTLGEEGEVIGDKYQGLVADRSGLLGGYRIAELQRALSALGVNRDATVGISRPRFLGGVARWRDSGMAGTPPAGHPRAFVRSGDAAVGTLRADIARLRPHVVVTYGPDGGYGHPDHIRAHEVTHAAVAAQADAGAWTPARIWWCVTETENLDAGLAALRAAGGPPVGWRWPGDGELASVPASSVDARVVGTAADLDAKRAAMVAHATQLWVADGNAGDVIDTPRTGAHGGPVPFCLSNLITQPLLGTESFMLGDRRDAGSGLSVETLDRLDCLFAEGR